jgi:hypothetical protein
MKIVSIDGTVTFLDIRSNTWSTLQVSNRAVNVLGRNEFQAPKTHLKAYIVLRSFVLVRPSYIGRLKSHPKKQCKAAWSVTYNKTKTEHNPKTKNDKFLEPMIAICSGVHSNHERIL